MLAACPSVSAALAHSLSSGQLLLQLPGSQAGIHRSLAVGSLLLGYSQVNRNSWTRLSQLRHSPGSATVMASFLSFLPTPLISPSPLPASLSTPSWLLPPPSALPRPPPSPPEPSAAIAASYPEGFDSHPCKICICHPHTPSYLLQELPHERSLLNLDLLQRPV